MLRSLYPSFSEAGSDRRRCRRISHRRIDQPCLPGQHMWACTTRGAHNYERDIRLPHASLKKGFEAQSRWEVMIVLPVPDDASKFRGACKMRKESVPIPRILVLSHTFLVLWLRGTVLGVVQIVGRPIRIRPSVKEMCQLPS